MNSDTLKGQWKQLKGKAKKTWSRITDDDLLRIEGNVQELSGVIQQRYGIAREDAERQIDDFISSSEKKSSKARSDYTAPPPGF